MHALFRSILWNLKNNPSALKCCWMKIAMASLEFLKKKNHSTVRLHMLQLHFLRLETNKQKNISFLCLPWAMCASWSTKRTFIGISHCTQFSNLLPLSWGFPSESMLFPDPRIEVCVRFLAPVAACFLHLPGSWSLSPLRRGWAASPILGHEPSLRSQRWLCWYSMHSRPGAPSPLCFSHYYSTYERLTVE